MGRAPPIWPTSRCLPCGPRFLTTRAPCVADPWAQVIGAPRSQGVDGFSLLSGARCCDDPYPGVADGRGPLSSGRLPSPCAHGGRRGLRGHRISTTTAGSLGELDSLDKGGVVMPDSLPASHSTPRRLTHPQRVEKEREGVRARRNFQVRAVDENGGSGG